MFSRVLLVLPNFVTVLFVLGVLALWAVQIRRFWSLYRHGRFAAIMPHGLMFRVEKKEPVFIPWSNITHISVKPSPLGAIISLKKERDVKEVLRIFSTRMEAELFVERAEAQRTSHDSAK